MNCSEYFPIFVSLLWVAGIFFHQGKWNGGGTPTQTTCTNQKKNQPNLNPIATRAPPLCTCEAVTWGKRSSPWGSPWSIWPNSKLLSCPEEVWWRWQPSLRPWSPAVPPGLLLLSKDKVRAATRYPNPYVRRRNRNPNN